VPEELLAAEILIIRVLDPPCAHHFVAESPSGDFIKDCIAFAT
jgi:hypothetical protein